MTDTSFDHRKATTSTWLYGRYQDSLVITSKEWADVCLATLQRINKIATVIRQSKSWEEVLSKIELAELESQAGTVLDAAFAESWDQIDPEPENDADSRMYGQFPPFEHCRWGLEWWLCTPCLDDSDMIKQSLPAEVMSLAEYPAISPMTEYTPCAWPESALPLIQNLASRHGAELHVADGMFAEIEKVWSET